MVEGYFWYFLGMTVFIVSVPNSVNIIIFFMMSHLIQYFWMKLIILRADLTRFYMYVYKWSLLLCTNLYEWLFNPQLIFYKGRQFVFTCTLARAEEILEHTWCLSSHGYILGILSSNFWSFYPCDALWRVNSVVHLAHYNRQSRYRYFIVCRQVLSYLCFYKPM